MYGKTAKTQHDDDDDEMMTEERAITKSILFLAPISTSTNLSDLKRLFVVGGRNNR